MRALVALLLLMLSTGLRPAAGAPLRVLNLKPNTTLRYPVALISGEADLPHGTELVVTNAASHSRRASSARRWCAGASRR